MVCTINLQDQGKEAQVQPGSKSQDATNVVVKMQEAQENVAVECTFDELTSCDDGYLSDYMEWYFNKRK